MRLIIDLGSSYCKYTMLENNTLGTINSFHYTTDEKIADVEILIKNFEKLEDVIICSVWRDSLNNQLVKMLKKNNIDSFYFLNPAENSFGIVLDHYNLEQLGADRLAVMIAAHSKYTGSKCIIDCGTAVTIDALTSKGHHKGGVIFPGLRSMYSALLSDTDLGTNEMSSEFNIYATSTQQAIYSGCLSALSGGIQSTVNQMQACSGNFDSIILTGGNADKILSLLSIKTLYEPKLLLEGLKEISNKI